MPITLAPDPAATAEVEGMRMRDLDLVSTRLGRVGKWNWANVLGIIAVLLLGADIGGWISAWPYFRTAPAPSHFDKAMYLGLLILVGAIGLTALIGAAVGRKERVESVRDIKIDLDDLLKAWKGQNGNV
jgi:hypothetical protein